jgi:hypothetical protein
MTWTRSSRAAAARRQEQLACNQHHYLLSTCRPAIRHHRHTAPGHHMAIEMLLQQVRRLHHRHRWMISFLEARSMRQRLQQQLS